MTLPPFDHPCHCSCDGPHSGLPCGPRLPVRWSAVSWECGGEPCWCLLLPLASLPASCGHFPPHPNPPTLPHARVHQTIRPRKVKAGRGGRTSWQWDAGVPLLVRCPLELLQRGVGVSGGSRAWVPQLGLFRVFCSAPYTCSSAAGCLPGLVCKCPRHKPWGSAPPLAAVTSTCACPEHPGPCSCTWS